MVEKRGLTLNPSPRDTIFCVKAPGLDKFGFSKYETPDVRKDPYYIKAAQTEESNYVLSEIKDAPKYVSV